MAPTHAAYGGAVFLGYHLVFEWLRHHEHTNLRPMFIDHQIAVSLIGMGAGMTALGGSPKAIMQGFLFSFVMVGPITYWLKLQGNMPGQMNRPANVYYQDGTSEEEIERFRHQDQIETMAYNMSSMAGYGYFTKDGRHM